MERKHGRVEWLQYAGPVSSSCGVWAMIAWTWWLGRAVFMLQSFAIPAVLL